MAKKEKEAEESSEKQEEKPKKSGGGIFKILIILILLIALGAGGFVGYTMFLKPKPAAETAEVDPLAQQAAAPAVRAPAGEPGPMQAYPPFVVNLADPGGNRYLKITLSLELSKDEKFPAEVVAKEPKIKDIIISILSSKTFDEISTTQGKIAMKQEILRRLNTIMSGGRIMDVYITEFVIQ